MKYRQAYDYLLGFVDYERKVPPGYDSSIYNLDAFREFLTTLGFPHRQLPNPILVAGTKGKGSVAALLASALTACGCRVGLFTSPHLESIRERIRTGNTLISEQEFASLVGKLRPLLTKREAHPSYRTVFEILTAMAFLHFIRHRVDFSVLEVGLGGRLDATNVVEPMVSVITSISLDHTERLGETLDRIAREKAGIIRQGGWVVSAPQDREAMRVIERECAGKGASLLRVGRDVQWEDVESSWRGNRLVLRTPDGHEETLRIPLPGMHQVENAAVAYLAIEALRRQGFQIGRESVRKGFKEVDWPGRFEVIGQRPWIVLDGAHNVDSARRLKEAVGKLFPGHPVTLMLGITKDKDIAGIMKVLLPIARNVILTRANHPRGASPSLLARIARELGSEAQIVIYESPAGALGQARVLARSDDLILGTGSLYLVGDLRRLLREDAQTARQRTLGNK